MGEYALIVIVGCIEWYRSVPLPTYSSEAGPVDIFWLCGEHFGVNPEVGDRFKFSLLDSHHLRGETLAHPACLLPAGVGVDSSSTIVAPLPADRDGGVIAELAWTYKAKVSMQAA